MLPSGKYFQLNLVTSTVDGAFRAEKNLILALASLQLNGARRAVSFFVLGFDLYGFDSGAGAYAHDGNSAVIGGHTLITAVLHVNLAVGDGGRTVWVRSEDENLVLQAGDEGSTFGDCGDEQR